MALFGQPSDQAVLRLEVEDIELVDPGRKDQQRRFEHLIGRRLVLDQFIERRAMDNGPFRCADVLADGKSLAVRQRHDNVAIVAFHVADQVFQPLDEAFPLGLDRAFQGIGIGGQKVRGRHHVNDLVGHPGDAAPVGFV